MTEAPTDLNHRTGLLLGVAATVMWGLFPLYWPLLEPAGPFEILAHRMVWSLLTMAIVIAVARKWRSTLALVRDGRTLTLLVLAAVVVSVNWGTYIYAVNHGHVVETALGYFINPLVTMLLGVVAFRERMRPLQWLAVAVAVIAVAELTFDYGRVPVVALVLALAFLIGVAAKGDSHFTAKGAAFPLLFVLTGVITVLPLVCFTGAATRVPMFTLGLLQYLAPTFQLIVGLTIRHEAMSTGRWIGFGIVWLALAIFTFDLVRQRGGAGYRLAETEAATQ